MTTAIARTGKFTYTAMLVSKASPKGWSKPTMLLRFAEQSDVHTMLIASDQALSQFQTCEELRIYDVELTGKCVKKE